MNYKMDKIIDKVEVKVIKKIKEVFAIQIVRKVEI